MTFFADLPARIATRHLVVARSGASTVAELAAIGRPSSPELPPHAIDQHQVDNDQAVDGAGGARRTVQEAFTPERLAQEIPAIAERPQRITDMAAEARSLGRLDAAG